MTGLHFTLGNICFRILRSIRFHNVNHRYIEDIITAEQQKSPELLLLQRVRGNEYPISVDRLLLSRQPVE